MNRQEISDRTGFDRGEPFDDEADVRQYFRVESLRGCVGPEVWDDLPDQTTLDEMAQAVIDHRWHMS